MNRGTRENDVPSPKGVIGCLTVGFEMLSRNLGLLALPVVLDLILWLGPRISVEPLMRRFVTFVATQATPDPEVAGQVEQAIRLLEQFGEQFNLLSLISRVPMLHAPSLLARHAPQSASPLGEPQVLSLSSVFALIPWWGGLVLVGLVFGFLYLNDLAHRVCAAQPAGEMSMCSDQGEAEDVTLLRGVWKFLRFILFALGMMMIGAVFFPSWLLVVALATMVARPLGVMVWIVGVGFVGYVALHLVFVVPGLLLGGRSLLRAIWESVLLSHVNLSSVLGLIVLVMVIYEGLGYAWSLPSGDSWALLVGILGNACVATGLTAAAFIFYQNRLAISRSQLSTDR